MQTRKDLHQAYRLTTQRVALALLQGRPGAAESPLRRTGVGTLCGLMVVVLIAAGFGITGLIFHGGARGLEQSGVLAIEKETGASYVYSSATHRMVPFVNYASARLAMPDASSIQRRLVSSRSLARYERGPLTGIVGAPASIPDPDRLARGPWSLCVRTTAGDAGRSIVSLVGGRDVGGQPLGDGQAVLVRTGPQPWLVWHNVRMRISAKDARALTAEAPVPVDARWLNGLAQGPDFSAPAIPGWATRVTGPDGAASMVGQVFEVAAVAGTPARWYVQLRDGLSGISQTQARLLLESAGTGGPGQVRIIAPGAAAAAPSKTNLYNDALPENPPQPVAYASSTPLCVVYRKTDELATDARFALGGTLPAMTESPISDGIDQVTIPGDGTFAGTLSSPGTRPQAYALITAQGLRYPIATPDDVAKLGYSARSAVPVPANLMQLFREGPVLSSDAARRPVPAR